MSEPDIILQVVGQLREDMRDLDRKIDQTVHGLSEVRENQRVANATLDQVLRQTTLTNGRVGVLEERVDLIERREIREDGIEDGKRAQRDAYRSAVGVAWKAIWSPAGRIVGALALLTAGWTAREMWPW